MSVESDGVGIDAMLKKFDLFAAAPGAVERLREVVLHAAVTGRLSERRADDAPVSDLIDAISSARKRAYKKEWLSLRVMNDEVNRPIAAPNHWVWITLKEIGTLSGGMTPSKAKSIYWDGDVNWFSSKDIKTDELINSELKITREGMDSTGLELYRPGCLVMVARSGILKHTFPVSILRTEGTVNQDLKVLSPFVGGLERFIQIMLRGLNSYIITSLVKTGMTVQSLKFDEFASQPFPLPPLAEQQRIVAKVDELMTVCDRLEAQQRERDTRHAALARAALARFAAAPTPDNLQYLFHPAYDIAPDELRKAILRMAVNGTLIPFAPQPGSHVSDHYDFINGYAFKSEWFRESGVRLCRNINVGHGSLNWHELACLDVDRASEYKRFSLGVGDIVLSLDRPIISTGLKVARIRPDDLPCLLLQRVAKPTPKHSDLSLDYFYLWLNSPCFMDAIDPGRSNGVPHISTREVLGLSLSMPPLDVQKDIVATVRRLMFLVDRYESQLATARNTATRLLDALVAELTGIDRLGAPAPSPASGAGLAFAPDGAESIEPTSITRDVPARDVGEGAGAPEAAARLLALLRDRGSLSSSEAQASTGLDPATLRGLFKTLIDRGLVRTEGQRRGTRYLSMIDTIEVREINA